MRITISISSNQESSSNIFYISSNILLSKEIEKKTDKKSKFNPSLTTTFFFSISFLRLKADIQLSYLGSYQPLDCPLYGRPILANRPASYTYAF